MAAFFDNSQESRRKSALESAQAEVKRAAADRLNGSVTVHFSDGVAMKKEVNRVERIEA